MKTMIRCTGYAVAGAAAMLATIAALLAPYWIADRLIGINPAWGAAFWFAVIGATVGAFICHQTKSERQEDD